jgi:hypothetical protein
VVLWVVDTVISGVWKIVRWDNVCVVGIIDLIEAAVVEVVPPLVPVDAEEFNGPLVSVGVLVKIPSVNVLAPATALVIFEVDAPFDVL